MFWLKLNKQLCEWFFPSVCLSVAPFSQPSSSVNGSVCLSVCPPSVRPSARPPVCLSVKPFSLWSHHSIIMKFSGVITNDRSDVFTKGQGQKSKVKVTEVKTQLSCFRIIIPAWFHIRWWHDAQCLVLFRRGALLIFKVICKISR